MKPCKTAGTVAAAAIGAAAAGYLFLIAPGRSRAGQRFPFLGQNIAHRGLHDASAGIPENSLAAFRAAGWRPEAVLGLLAASCGWAATDEPVALRDLLPRFDLATIPRAPWVLPPRLAADVA